MAKQINLNRFLKNADERVRRAAADALNKASAELVAKIKGNMSAAGIKERTGELRGSITVKEATEKNVNVMIKSEVYKPLPRRQGYYNPAMRGRYPSKGVPYGRIIEFSPRIRRPFFYTAWYSMRTRVKQEIMEEIGRAWSKS